MRIQYNLRRGLLRLFKYRCTPSFISRVVSLATPFNLVRSRGVAYSEKRTTSLQRTKVATYNPNDVIEMTVVLKLEHCRGVKLLSLLQTKLDKFKERAGFSMPGRHQHMSDSTCLPWSLLYDYRNPSALCIISWIEDTNPSLPPTWGNLLKILREHGINLGNLADQIEKNLEFKENVWSIEEPNTTGLQDVATLRSCLESLCDGNQKSATDQQFREQLKTCCDICQIAFLKLGKDQRGYIKAIEQLREEKGKLTQVIKDIMEPDELQPPSKSHRVCKSEESKPMLKDLMRELREKAADWEDLGIELEISDGELKQIKLDNPGDSKSCLRELFRKWLYRVDPEPSWEAIADAVHNGLRDQELASRLKSK